MLDLADFLLLMQKRNVLNYFSFNKILASEFA